MPESDLHISERLRKLLPPLTAEERKQLKENIESDGEVRDPLSFWNDGKRNVVVDGMHRWEIVRGTEIPYTTRELIFDDYEAAELWILNHQLGRRNLLKPADFRKIIAELYDHLKTQRGGDRKSEKSKCQNEPLIGDAAEQVAEKAGISPSKVKRVNARVALESTLTKAAKVVSADATDAEVKALAQLLAGEQDQVARAIRTGQSKSIKEAIKVSGAKPPKDETPAKQPKKTTRDAWYRQWNTAIGPLVRLVDRIANDLDDAQTEYHDTVQDHLQIATEEMMEWLGQTS